MVSSSESKEGSVEIQTEIHGERFTNICMMD